MTPLRLLLMEQVQSCGNKACTLITSHMDLRSKTTPHSNVNETFQGSCKITSVLLNKIHTKKKTKAKSVFVYSLATVECDPCCRLYVFLGLAPVTYFPALGIGCNVIPLQTWYSVLSRLILSLA